MTLPEASAHSYLGGVDDLEGRTSLLEPGSTYTLPLMPLDGVVLCPGDSLPHRLLLPSDRLVVRQALEAAPPVRRLIVVVCCQDVFHRSVGMHLESIGCTAEIIKMSDDGVNIIAIGRQRVQLALDQITTPFDLHHIPVSVVPDWPATPLPRCAIEGAASWPPWVYRQVDAVDLAARVKTLFAERMPSAQPFQGNDPLQLSYWLVSNLPFDNIQRQKLLAAPEVIQRLNMEIEWLSELTHLYCMRCHSEVANAQDATPLGDEGVSGRYVNSHAVIHDVLTVSQAFGLGAVGEPERQHSWFPGYAWQIAYCSECNYHLGWKFTKIIEGEEEFRRIRRFAGNVTTGGDAGVEEEVPAIDQEPPRPFFWGLRRAAVTPNPEALPLIDYGWQVSPSGSDISSGGDSEEEEGEGEGEEEEEPEGEEDGEGDGGGGDIVLP